MNFHKMDFSLPYFFRSSDHASVRVLRRALRLGALTVSGSLFFPTSLPAQTIQKIWTAEREFTLGPAASAADIDGNGNLEIILVDGAVDRLCVLEPMGGSTLWLSEFPVAGDFTFPAVAGQFTADGTVDIVVVSSGGTLICVDGLTGNLLGLRELDSPPAASPTVVPLPSVDSDPSSFREGVALIDEQGMLRVYEFADGGTPESVLQFQLESASDNPPLLASLGGDFPDPGLLVLTEKGRLTVVSLRGDSKADFPSFSIGQGKLIKTFVAAGDISGDGRDDLVVADDRGWLRAFTTRGNRLSPIWPQVSIRREPTSPLVLVDVDNDHHLDVLVHRDTEILLINGATGQLDLWPAKAGTYVHDTSISSPPAAFERAGGGALAAFGDLSGRVWLLDLSTGDLLKDEDGEPFQFEAGGSNAARTTLLAGPLRGLPLTDLFLLGARNGEGFLLDTGLPWPKGLPAWSGRMGGVWRTGSIPTQFAQYAEIAGDASEAKFQRALEAGRAAAAEKRWEEVLASSELALAMRPHDDDALKLKSQAMSNMHRGRRTLALFLILGAIAGTVALGGRTAIRMLRRAMAQKALQSGRKQDALKHLRAVHAAAPGNQQGLKALADLLLEMKDYSAESAPIYEAARQAFPNDDRYSKGLAYTYSAQGRRDQKAADAYAGMVRVVSHPGPWAFTLAQTLESLGKDREALDAYHLAIRHGFESPDLDEALASLYVKLEFREPEILPILRRVLDRRMNDTSFLHIYCLCVARAREFDEDAERAALRLFELDPGAASARLVLATRLLQAGKIKDARVHAEALGELSAGNVQAQLLLAECYAVEGNQGEEARAVYERALEANPDASNIQAALANIYATEKRTDPEALELFRKTVDMEACSPDFLAHVGNTAMEMHDAPLLMASVERLRQLGPVPPELLVALAHAYISAERSGAIEEQVLKQAFAIRSDDQKIAAELAHYYIEQDRTDAEAIAVYEAACAIEPKPLEVIHQLIKAYSDSQVSERALVLAREFLEKHPGDTTLVKLAAGASAALDQLDDAIRDYEGLYQNDPEDAEALTQLARLYGRKDRTDEEAMALYRKAIEASPDSIDLHEALARGQASRGNWDDVVETIKHFLTFAPRQIDGAIELMKSLSEGAAESVNLRWFLVETMILRSQFPQAIGQIRALVEADPSQGEQALAAYEKILDRQGDQADAHHHRGNLLVQLGRVSEARQALERAQRLRPKDEALIKDLVACYEKLIETRDSPEVRLKLGRLALRLARYDLAISCFQRTDKDDRWATESIRSLGHCFLAKGMLDLALQELKKIEVDDETKVLLYQLGRAYESAGDPRGAREAYKSIYAVDIGFQDVKTRMDALFHAVSDPNSPERTAIISSLSEEAKTRYDLIQELGRGAMGIVYKARDNELEEIVALKILPESLEKNVNALRMFRQEARNARRLAHNGIVRIHDIGEERGRKYISMEFVDGIDLKQRLIEAKRNLPFEETLHYAKQIAEAMAAAHAAHIVHRDLKPANIMITKQRRVKVTDFGIAKMIQDETTKSHTKSRTVVGTPLYMSPEQVKGEAVDSRADIYSMGVMFYEMATGRPPFIEGDLAYHHVTTPPEPLPDRVPSDFARVVMKCLEKKPEDRWQSANEIVAELEKVEGGEPDATGT